MNTDPENISFYYNITKTFLDTHIGNAYMGYLPSQYKEI